MAFEDLIGNEKVKSLLNNAVQTNSVLHSYLFTGIDGIGKILFAREFANMILCTQSDEKPCKNCKSCIEFKSDNHPDFLQIEPEDGKTIKIEQIRYLQEKIAEKPVTSEKKVYIIDKCDTMTREAANSLLKTLEEPPTYAVIILITSNESKLLVTIKSRCAKISFMPLTKEEIKKYLIKNRLENNITDSMMQQCQGSIGRVLKILEQQEVYLQVEEIITKLQTDIITQIWKDAEVLYQAKEKIIDLLDYMNVIFFENLKSEENSRYIKCISIVEETKKKINANANYDMSIDNLLLRLWEEFH